MWIKCFGNEGRNKLGQIVLLLQIAYAQFTQLIKKESAQRITWLVSRVGSDAAVANIIRARVRFLAEIVVDRADNRFRVHYHRDHYSSLKDPVLPVWVTLEGITRFQIGRCLCIYNLDFRVFDKSVFHFNFTPNFIIKSDVTRQKRLSLFPEAFLKLHWKGGSKTHE